MFSADKDMDGIVRNYELPLQQTSASGSMKLVWFLSYAVFIFGFRWSIDQLFHLSPESAWHIGFFSIMLAACFTLLPRLSGPHGSLTIGENYVEGRTRAGWFTFKKRIHSDQIQTISENGRGICVFDRGEFAARMLGFVFIPAGIPEYQEIRSILAQWHTIGGKS